MAVVVLTVGVDPHGDPPHMLFRIVSSHRPGMVDHVVMPVMLMRH
jgi:hypothetical protein